MPDGWENRQIVFIVRVEAKQQFLSEIPYVGAILFIRRNTHLSEGLAQSRGPKFDFRPGRELTLERLGGKGGGGKWTLYRFFGPKI